MIEMLEAVRDVEAIAAVPGVDSLLMGNNDLTAEMGIPGLCDSPRVRGAYVQTLHACKQHGVYLGIGGLSPRLDLLEKYCGIWGQLDDCRLRCWPIAIRMDEIGWRHGYSGCSGPRARRARHSDSTSENTSSANPTIPPVGQSKHEDPQAT
jgi:hypothetical protein